MPTRPVLLARDGIKKLIAHREPMLFVDRVIEHATGARLVAEADGVPADPLQILEAMGQASALLIRQVSSRLFVDCAHDKDALL